jgi:hypothetical protein
VHPSFRDISREQQGVSHKAMPDHERDCRRLLLRARQELRREIATNIAVEGRKIRTP